MPLRRPFFFLVFLHLSLSLSAMDLSAGLRGIFSLGQGCGKGFWDWTDTQSEGSLFMLPGGGAALSVEWGFSEYLMMETGFLYIYGRCGQTLDDTEYRYGQHSMELPLLLKGRIPLGRRDLMIALGPSLVFLPGDAVRKVNGTGIPSPAGRTVLAGLQAGVDYRIPRTGRRTLVFAFRFVHPLMSPEYGWEPSGSGNFRINRFDFSLGIQYSLTGGPR